MDIQFANGLTYENVTINNNDELINYVSDRVEENQGLNKSLIDILNESGIKDTINLIDDRTEQLMKLYEFYKYSPHQLDYGIFFNTVLILNPIYKVQNYGF